jgi:hypothetical protein
MSKQPSPPANIFYADTRFERLARRPGGVEREQAIQRAQTEVDDMKADFGAWIDGEFERLNAALSKAADAPGDKTALERANFYCAQLRDVGATMGYELVTFVARTLCEILDAYVAGAPYDQEIIDCHRNAFLLARMEQYRHLRPDQVPDLANGLLRVVEIASIIPPDPVP